MSILYQCIIQYLPSWAWFISLSYLQDKTENWNKGGVQQLMGLSSAMTHRTGDMECQEATSYSQAGSPTEQMVGTPIYPQNF